ncbi:MAG: cupin domain-containing protein [Pseudomonadota bacterium]
MDQRLENAPRLWAGQAFTISHADDSPFVGEGLRAFFEYRHLGIAEATDGKFAAHVIRAVPGMHSEGQWHIHHLDFQMVFVTKGWVVFEYEESGEHMLRAGSCVLQPPGIRHREVRHSDDMELIEITSPAAFETTPVDAPSPT